LLSYYNKFTDYNDYPHHKNQLLLQHQINIPLQVQVAHFTPSSFPLIPTVNKTTSHLCAASWAIIEGQSIKINDYDMISGMAAYYSEFYDRLEQFDSTGKFDAVLSRNSKAEDQISAKGAIILRIVKFVVRLDPESPQNEMVLYMLGKSHLQKAIRPWQYSIFVQTLLNTIASRLGTDATSEVMEAWVNLFAYVMQGMLPAAIKGQVVETELSINTSSAFDNGKILDEIREFKLRGSQANKVQPIMSKSEKFDV
jgi:hemoglobin-like flavoprotein